MSFSKLYRRLFDAAAWRIRRALGDGQVDRTIINIARNWRPFLKQPIFIGISGSAGKTTTKELLLGVLSCKGKGTGSPGSLNVAPEVAKTILRVRPKHDFCVAELSEDKPGVLDLPLALLQPNVGIVTVIGNDHWSAFVGLGNPEPRYIGTPQNVGYELVDQMAASLDLAWEATPEAWIARGSSKGRAVCLIKIRMPMNANGAGLKQLSESMAFSPEQCILVFDDLDLPIGDVKTRIKGGAGGHRGVASVLEAFQTDAIRRVKIGVDQEGAKLNRVDYVLTPFAAASRDAVEQTISTAEAHVLNLVTARTRGTCNQHIAVSTIQPDSVN